LNAPAVLLSVSAAAKGRSDVVRLVWHTIAMDTRSYISPKGGRSLLLRPAALAIPLLAACGDSPSSYAHNESNVVGEDAAGEVEVEEDACSEDCDAPSGQLDAGEAAPDAAHDAGSRLDASQEQPRDAGASTRDAEVEPREAGRVDDASTARDSGSSAAADAAAAGDAGSSNGGSDASSSTGTRRVTIRFRAEVSGEPFACGRSYDNQGTPPVSATPSDLRMFVHQVRLIGADGSDTPVQLDTRESWQVPEAALIDFEDAQGACVNGNAGTNLELTGTVPAGSYTGVAFKNGLPPALNHGDPALAPAPLRNAPAMLWTWAQGYKFLVAELQQVVPTGQFPGHGWIHLGSAACVNQVCQRPNQNEVRLTGFDIDSNVVVLDLGAVLAQTDLTQESECHASGSVCGSGYSALGVNFATGQALATFPAFRVE